MTLIVANSGFHGAMNYCMPVGVSDDAVVSDDNNSRSDSPVSEPKIMFLKPKKDDVSEQEREARRISRIPCKARGVTNTSIPHTARNAFIDIPSNAVHGMMLICSHDICAKSRRFRYCTVCGIPVAKRNFLKRHGHGLLKARQRVLVPEEPTSPIEERPAKRPRASPDPPPLPPVQPTTIPTQGTDPTSATDGPIVMEVTPEERKLLELFRSRPQFAEPQTADAWAQKILAVATANRTPPPPNTIQFPSHLNMTDEIADDSSVDEYIGKWFEEV